MSFPTLNFPARPYRPGMRCGKTVIRQSVFQQRFVGGQLAVQDIGAAILHRGNITRLLVQKKDNVWELRFNFDWSAIDTGFLGGPWAKDDQTEFVFTIPAEYTEIEYDSSEKLHFHVHGQEVDLILISKNNRMDHLDPRDVAGLSK